MTSHRKESLRQCEDQELVIRVPLSERTKGILMAGITIFIGLLALGVSVSQFSNYSVSSSMRFTIFICSILTFFLFSYHGISLLLSVLCFELTIGQNDCQIRHKLTHKNLQWDNITEIVLIFGYTLAYERREDSKLCKITIQDNNNKEFSFDVYFLQEKQKALVIEQFRKIKNKHHHIKIKRQIIQYLPPLLD